MADAPLLSDLPGAALLSSSTKRRISALNNLRERVLQVPPSTPELRLISALLLTTYPLYADRPSRRAVQLLLGSLARNPESVEFLESLVRDIHSEAVKTSLAPGNYFVLVEWCCRIIQDLALRPDSWLKCRANLVDALSAALERTLSESRKPTLKKSAISLTRRAFRAVLKSKALGHDVVATIVSDLSKKAARPTARNAPLLGVLAGVCARLPNQKDSFGKIKGDCFEFYTREIVGSRTVLPEHIANGLHDLFTDFVSLADLQRQIVPAIEKALLRAPEVVLNSLIVPMIQALPLSLDLSELLLKNFLKPLLSNIKSTNQSVKTGAVETFKAIASRCRTEPVVDKIADEILNPLLQNKVPSAEQKALYSQILSSLPASPLLAKKIPPSLTKLTAKEANESVLDAATTALAKHAAYGLENGVSLDASVVDAFAKGLSDKRINVRRIWALRAADIVSTLSPKSYTSPDVAKLLQLVLKAGVAITKEVSANPIQAAQGGLATCSYIMTALSASYLRDVPDLVALRGEILHNSQVKDGSSSYLLNQRVYTKISEPDDMKWIIRAICSLRTEMNDSSDAIKEAWSQAVLYFVTTSSLPTNVKREAEQCLRREYFEDPSDVGDIVVRGMWCWLRNLTMGDKDSAAVLSKSGPERLEKAIQIICPSPYEIKKHPTVTREILAEQMIDLMVLARADLIPRAPWIDLCLKVQLDPGELVARHAAECVQQVEQISMSPAGKASEKVRLAAYHAAGDLAFVAPEAALPLLLSQLRDDLDPAQLTNIGQTEAQVFRTPEGTLFVDVLAAPSRDTVIDKKAKDYDTLKWEEELRAQIAKKAQQPKKLTAEDQARVKAQLEKESKIRKAVGQVFTKVQRGVGVIQALATGPLTKTELWIMPAIDMLQEVIEAGAGLLLGSSASLAYLDCAQTASPRLGSLRPFIGIATLRAIGVTQLAPELVVETLQDLVTRVLYRVRFLGEQVQFDVVTVAYILPLVFLVLESGGFSPKGSEEADEQLVLTLEFLSLHSEICANEKLPRRRLLSSLISAMQRFNQHYKLVKECFQYLVSNMEPTITAEETKVILRGAIVPEVPVRTAVLQAVDNDLDLSDMEYCEEIWLACHDVVVENEELGRTIWEESSMKPTASSALSVLAHLSSEDRQLRLAASSSCAEAVLEDATVFQDVLDRLESMYSDAAKPKAPARDEYGIPRRAEVKDPWEVRSGTALAFKALAKSFRGTHLVPFMGFLIEKGPLGDRNETVRDEMIDAATAVITIAGAVKVEDLMNVFETALEAPDTGSETSDKINEAVIILYGALAQHLKAGDKRVPKVVQRLLETLSTPSETVQSAVAQCLPPLVRASSDKASDYVQRMMEQVLHSKTYAMRRGAAYGLAGIVSGRGIGAIREFRILSALKSATEAKKDQNQRQGAFLCYELFSLILGPLFEPYVIQIVPQLLAGFGDPGTEVRDSCLDAAKACFASLSSYGVKQVLPTLLEGLDDQQWRSKKGACDSLGAMAYLDPQELAHRLPEIIPPLANVLNDSHKEVRLSANRSLQRFGDVISNPEIKGIVSTLLRALSDPTRFTDDALDALIKIQFVHYLDAPSLALVVRILERGLGDRSATKRKAAQIIGSLAHLTDRKDLTAHLPILVAGLRITVVDPVPATRATASKALGSLVEKLGEDALPDLIPSLMATLKSDTGAGDRLGSAQALSEVLAGLGTSRLEETLPSILQNVSSSKPSVREGFMSLFIFLPACFGTSFSNYLSKIIPPILAGLADDVESIRDTALRAGRLLVKNFSSRAIDLLLPELERGLADLSYRIRLSSVELIGDLLFNLTGITTQTEEDEDIEEGATEAGQSLLEVLGEERRNRVLSALYICRCDTSGIVRTAAINVWKALVATPRTLREIVPTLTQLIIRRLASSDMEQKIIAGNALGELIRKAGEGVLATLLPTLGEGLLTTDAESRLGICMALRDIILSSSAEALEDYEKTLISTVRMALVDSDLDVREAAAEAFDALQHMFGKKVIDQVLPDLLNLLRTEAEAQNALSALLTLLTDSVRSNIILPNLLPDLLRSPITVFNARAIASLAEVASSAMTRRLSHIINSLVNDILACKDEQRLEALGSALDTVLLSVDESDGLNTSMSAMLALVKDPDYRKRRIANSHLANFLSGSELDISRYYPDLIRVFLMSFDDSDKAVVQAAWKAQNELTKRLNKEDMDELVISTRTVLLQVGVAGSNLPGFELPKGINAVLPIFLQGLMYGTTEQRTAAALALSDLIDRASVDALKPFVTQITGPLIRVVSERSVEVKAAILLTMNNLLIKIPQLLKPFFPQLQRTFARALADPSSAVLRTRAAKALGTLITMTPRVDPLIVDLVAGSKTSDEGIKSAMLKALYEVVSKAGKNISEASRASIIALVDGDEEQDYDMMIAYARLIGALVKVLPAASTTSILKNHVLPTPISQQSILALNAVLVEAPESLTETFNEETLDVICQGMKTPQAAISENATLAAGKYLLSPAITHSYESTRTLFETLATIIPPGTPPSLRRLALVVARTAARAHNEQLVRPHLALLAPAIFEGVRDAAIPVKLAAEAAFLAAFAVVDEEGAVFERYLAGAPGQGLQPAVKRGMGDYFRRVALRLGAQARERREAEGGAGGLGLTSDEVDDEREVWSVGKVDLGEGTFGE